MYPIIVCLKVSLRMLSRKSGTAGQLRVPVHNQRVARRCSTDELELCRLPHSPIIGLCSSRQVYHENVHAKSPSMNVVDAHASQVLLPSPSSTQLWALRNEPSK